MNFQEIPPGVRMRTECNYEYSGQALFGAAFGTDGPNWAGTAQWVVSTDDPPGASRFGVVDETHAAR
jgi:hypothetical protein